MGEAQDMTLKATCMEHDYGDPDALRDEAHRVAEAAASTAKAAGYTVDPAEPHPADHRGRSRLRPFEPEAASPFFQFIPGRYERALVIIAGKPFGRWEGSSATTPPPP